MTINPETALHRVEAVLADVAAGRRPAELVIRNTSLVNVNTAEIQPGIDIAVACERIALVGDAAHTVGKGTVVVDGTGLYAAPGFIDGHMHVESSLMTVREYARQVIPHGTTAIFPDPHEIASVLGLDGMEFMLEDAKEIPLRVFYAMPSCLPAMAGFEDYGHTFTAEETARLIERDDLYALGEMMDFPGVVSGDKEVHGKISATLRCGKPVTGHYASSEVGAGLNAYVASGVGCCHESVTRQEVLAKARLGMVAQIREGACSKDLTEGIKAVTETGIDTRFITLVTDDCHPAALVEKGNMDHILRRAVEEGVDPVRAIQMVSLNSACCHGMEKDLGSLSPGKLADIVLLADLETMRVEKVFIGGAQVAEAGVLTAEISPSAIPPFVMNSVHIEPALTAAAFDVPAPAGAGPTVATHVIGVVPGDICTQKRVMDLPVEDGLVQADPARDVAKIAVVDHHRKNGIRTTGFVTGMGIKNGAVASTVGHDAHNMVLIGSSGQQMALAARAVAGAGGGMAVVRAGQVETVFPLPVAGLMSAESAEMVAQKMRAFDDAMAALGCPIDEPFYLLSFLSLGVLPSIRITNQGLVDTDTCTFIPLFPQG